MEEYFKHFMTSFQTLQKHHHEVGHSSVETTAGTYILKYN